MIFSSLTSDQNESVLADGANILCPFHGWSKCGKVPGPRTHITISTKWGPNTRPVIRSCTTWQTGVLQPYHQAMPSQKLNGSNHDRPSFWLAITKEHDENVVTKDIFFFHIPIESLFEKYYYNKSRATVKDESLRFWSTTSNTGHGRTTFHTQKGPIKFGYSTMQSHGTIRLINTTDHVQKSYIYPQWWIALLQMKLHDSLLF